MQDAPFRYAAHAYGWTNSWVRSDVQIIDRVAALGLDAIEIPLMELAEVVPSEISRRAEENGIDVVTSVGLSADKNPASEKLSVRKSAEDFLLRCVDVAADMGSPLLTGVIYSDIGGVLPERPTAVHYERAAEVLRVVSEYARDRDVRLGIEPVNRYETYLVNTASAAMALASLVDDAHTGVHLDAYHMNIEEDQFYAPIMEAMPRLCHFHLSESHRGIPGKGTVDWTEVFRALRDGDYVGYVGLESFVGASPAMAGATRSWRDLAPDSDTLIREGLDFLKQVERAVYDAG
jgi:D-psicose/D-tagatose/L-ribulose 3-epimerase